MLRTILIVIAIVLILSFFHFDLRSLVESAQAQKNLLYLWEIVQNGALYVWHHVVLAWEGIRGYIGK